MEDAAAIVRKARLDWDAVFDEMLRQEGETGKLFSVSVLDTVEVLEGCLGIKIPLKRKLVSHCLEAMLVLAVREPKTLGELDGLVGFPRYRIRSALKKLEKKGRIRKAGNRFVAKG